MSQRVHIFDCRCLIVAGTLACNSRFSFRRTGYVAENNSESGAVQVAMMSTGDRGRPNFCCILKFLIFILHDCLASDNKT